MNEERQSAGASERLASWATSELQPMSIDDCRPYLEGLDLSDEEIARLRDALYVLVRKVFDEIVPW
jgi:hypothetical protein